MFATLTEATCSVACWQAREDVCRCSCGGSNHGIHLRGGEATRTCRVNGVLYELVAVGGEERGTFSVGRRP